MQCYNREDQNQHLQCHENLKHQQTCDFQSSGKTIKEDNEIFGFQPLVVLCPGGNAGTQAWWMGDGLKMVK
jgi:hypothetical protein